MNETQKRINAYKAALPELRERVLAVALLLAMSAAMMTSASFAWITLSRAPEVANVSTTVAANGNLEIALVPADGSEPAESAIGDSSAAEGNTVTAANVTWGNLVNLSDSSYGLSNIVLRPALLGNTNNLLNQPLKGVDYGSDGRIQQYYNEDFQFTNWVEPKNDVDGYFKFNVTPQYGVRAISTVEYTYVNNSYYQFTQLMKMATSVQGNTQENYNSMISNVGYINALAGLIGDFMTDKLNDSDTDVSGYVEDLYNMLIEFEELVDGFGDAIVALANTQVYNKYGPDAYSTYTYTKTTFFEATASELKANGVVLDCLDDYLKIQSKVQTAIYGSDPDIDDGMKDFYDRIQANASAKVLLSELLPIINNVVKINSCQIILADGTTYTVGSLGMSAALDLLGKDIDAKITEGILKDFEQLSGCKMLAKDVDVSAKYILTVTMTAKTITTAAADPFLFDTDVHSTEQTASENKGDYTGVAQDTYGMAVDLWVRTNAANSYLVLEGNVLTQTDSVRATGVDTEGNVVELYTVTITSTVEYDDGTTEQVSESVAVYKKTVDGTEVWYNANNHSLIYDEDGNPPEGQTITTPIERYEEVVSIIGYEGENRVWDRETHIFLDSNSTTQGSGSCYVFYAEDPAQQENSLRLLANLRVAFIDSTEGSDTYGKMIATAQLDIDNRYEESGKVTLPLKLVDDGSSYLTKTDSGLAIMAMEQNKATRLTAVVYLDGRNITNSDVLAASDIQGQLNIQFGSSVEMNPISDEKLESQTRSISVASRKAGAPAYDESNSEITFNYDTDFGYMTVDVKVTVVGDAPTSVSAFFMRKVSETQGSRENSFALSPTEESGVYTGSYTFSAPGSYVLRTVRLDGQDYDLPVDSYPNVSISGFAINSVSMYYNGSLVQNQTTPIKTSNRSVSTELALKFASDQMLPGSVQLQFLKDDGTQVTSRMTYNSTSDSWTGSATFTSSGTYTLKYVILDGEYTELEAKYQKALDISMGLTVRVRAGTEQRTFTYLGESYTIPMYADIYDDSGMRIQYLSGVKLVYTRSGSNVDGANPDLKWNASEGCYIGNLQIASPGIYEFNSVMIGEDPLKKTTIKPPKFTCDSPDPPVYKDAQPMEGMDYLLSTGNNTYTVGVRIENAAGATVTAYLYNADDGKTSTVTTMPVTPEGSSLSYFYFTLPQDLKGYQVGDWTITKLELANVYDQESNFYGENNPMTMDLSQSTDDLNVKVVSVKPVLEGSDETFSGSFMESKYSEKTVTLKITDQLNKKLNFTIENVRVQYMLDTTTTDDYGGYTASHLDGSGEGEDDTYTLTAEGDGITYKYSNIKLTYAGVYSAHAITFDVKYTDENGIMQTRSYKYMSPERETGAYDGILDIPVYTLNTTVPTVTITGISPTDSNPTKITYTTESVSGWLGGGTRPTFTVGTPLTSSFNQTTNEATLYAVATADNSTQRHGSFTRPTLTVTVAGVDSGCTVSFTLPGGSADAITFSRTGNGTITNTLGKVSQFKSWTSNVILTHTLDAYYGHGTQTITTMTIVKDNVTYTVTLSKPIVINNPSSVNQ